MKLSNSKTRALLIAAAVPVLIAGLGCMQPSVYKRQYYDQLDKNNALQTQNQHQAQMIIEREEVIEYLEGKMGQADTALTAQSAEARAKEARKRALLTLLKSALDGTPAEAERRGDNYVVITRFSFVPGRADLDRNAKRDLKKIANGRKRANRSR